MPSPGKWTPTAARRIAAPLLKGVVAVLCAGWFAGGAARASEPWQPWPELGLFVTPTPQVRLFFDEPYTKGTDTEDQSLETVACVDIRLKPILRPTLPQEDWAWEKYCWMRLGTAGREPSARRAPR